MISVSICTFHTPISDLDKCLDSLTDPVVDRVTIIDNGREPRLEKYARRRGVAYIASPNLGYGHAHNLALMQSKSEFHLVINADVYFKSEALGRMAELMLRNPQVVQMQPRVLLPDGTPQYGSRRLPSPLILVGRRFFPALTERANEHYLLKDMDLTRPIEVPYQLGNFMLMRTAAAQSIGGFDERFFMYPEDIDLSRRMARIGTVLYWPGESIVHNHAAASYSSGRMLRIHCVNMLKYFAKWAVKGAPFQRTKINRSITYANIESI